MMINVELKTIQENLTSTKQYEFAVFVWTRPTQSGDKIRWPSKAVDPPNANGL
jgi:hypothetical protein